jgi:hypothetical protein
MSQSVAATSFARSLELLGAMAYNAPAALARALALMLLQVAAFQLRGAPNGAMAHAIQCCANKKSVVHSRS